MIINSLTFSLQWWFQNRRRRVRQHQRPGKPLVMKGQQRRQNRHQSPYETQQQSQHFSSSSDSLQWNYNSTESSPSALEEPNTSNSSSPVWDLQQCQETFSNAWQNSFQQQQVPSEVYAPATTYSDQQAQYHYSYNQQYYCNSQFYNSPFYTVPDSIPSCPYDYFPNDYYHTYEYPTAAVNSN